MQGITSYIGETLLQPETVSAIEKLVDLLIEKNNIAGAWQAAQHIKKELSQLPADKVKTVIDSYRTLSTRLKTLALPLLEEQDITSLLENNIQLVTEAQSALLCDGLRAWLFALPEEDRHAKAGLFLAVVERASVPIKQKVVECLQSMMVEKPASVIFEPVAEEAESVPETNTASDPLLDAEEVAELEEHKNKTASLGTPLVAVHNTDADAEKIYALAHTSDDKKRFVERAASLLTSRVRDIRTDVELREYFSRPFAVGGLGLSGDALQKSLAIAKELYASEHSPEAQSRKTVAPRVQKPVAPSAPIQTPHGGVSTVPQTAVPEVTIATSEPAQKPIPTPRVSTPTDAGKAAIDKLIAHSTMESPRDLLASLIKRSSAIHHAPSGQLKPEKTALSSGEPRVLPKEKTQVPVRIAPLEPRVPKLQKEEPVEQRDTSEPRRITRPTPQFSNITKPRVADVTFTQPSPREAGVVGLSDELGLMTIEEFRRLGDAEVAKQALLHKISVLSADSYTSMVQGVKRFRQSPLYQQYLAIGEASIESDKKLPDILADEAHNPSHMTEDEFFTVSSISSVLKI